jgi:hypothetical protein
LDKLQIKPQELKNIIKHERKRRGVKTKDDKKSNQKRRKTIKHKVKMDGKKLDKKVIKKKEPKIKVQSHELLAFTPSYLMLAHC